MSIDKITSGPLASVADLIELERSLNPMHSPPRRWAFRGQPRDYGTLIPSFPRQFSREASGAAEIIERRLVDAFRKHYADLKDRSPDMPLPDLIGPNHDLLCLSVMQHYEIPTRLLDWTAQFWTAIYFACASDPGSKAELWYYDRQIFDPQFSLLFLSLLEHPTGPEPEPPFLNYPGESKVLEFDPMITPRMKKQVAHHTVSSKVFSDHTPLLLEQQQKLPNNVADSHMVHRVIIDGSCKRKALQYLAEECNINAGTLFPDIVGLGRYLKWQFESLRTMLL